MHRKQTTDSTGKTSSIRFKLLLSFIPVGIAAIILIVLIVYSNVSAALLSRSETILKESSSSVVNQTNGWISTNLSSLKAERAALQYIAPRSNAEIRKYLESTKDQNEAYPNGTYVGKTDGTMIDPAFTPDAGYDPRTTTWYKSSINADKFTFGPVYKDADTKKYIVSASAALKGKNDSTIGVMAADISLDAIAKIVQPVTIGSTGGIFLVDKSTNFVIGSKDSSAIGITLDQQKDGMYQFAGEIIKQNKTGVQNYVKNGSNLYLDIEAIPNSSWVAVAYEPKSEVLSGLDALTRNLILIAAGVIALLMLLTILLIQKLVLKPVYELNNTAKTIADGNLNATIRFHSNDEIGQLSANFNKTVLRLKNYVNYIAEIAQVLKEIANNNLDFKLKYDYVGEFAKVKKALESISASLSKTLGAIQRSADQVSGGADQVAAGAQSLSQGATEQAASVEELAATIDSISVQIKDNADKAMQANNDMDAVGKQLMESNQQMKDMIAAMGDISSTSDQISKIIKTIEDIAFQTNILALNAAVEAARAGTAGKGFSVVADEVRRLASKSADASKSTAELIDRSLHAVKHGSKIANETAKSLVSAVDGTKTIAKDITQIAETSHNQAESIAQVTQGINQISSVVQTTSATSEESAAASEELSGQAQMLNGLIGRFKIRSSSAENTASDVSSTQTSAPSSSSDSYADDNSSYSQHSDEKYHF